MLQPFILFSVLLLSLPQSDCARILAVFSFPILGYQEINRVLTEELLQHGHELVVLTTDLAYPNGNAPPKLTEIDVHDVSYHVWEELEDSMKADIENARDDGKLPHDITETINKIFLLQINSEGFQKLLHDDNKFDLILLEAGISSNMILSHIFKAPVIIVSSYGSNYMDVPSVEKVYQSISRQNNLAFWKKMYEIYKAFSFEQFIGELEEEQDQHIESVVGYNRPTLRELQNNVDVLFLNEYPMWEGVKPMTPSTVSLGRLQTKPGKALPQDLQKFFNSSTRGVIYVNVCASIKSSLLPPEKINTIVKVMSKLPYDVLFKWDEDELPGSSSNIKIIKQIPQLDVLNHSKLRLLINDGDLKSSDEAISAGVPVIGIPFMSNQFFNTENYERFKIGLKLDLLTLTEENLKNAVNTVITDQSYRDNTVHLRSLMFDQRQRPLTRAIWWIEYVLKFKGAHHLRSPVTNMHWTEYYQLELIFFVIFLYVMAMFTLMIFCYFLFLLARSGYRIYLRRNLKSKTYFP